MINDKLGSRMQLEQRNWYEAKYKDGCFLRRQPLIPRLLHPLQVGCSVSLLVFNGQCSVPWNLLYLVVNVWACMGMYGHGIHHSPRNRIDRTAENPETTRSTSLQKNLYLFPSASRFSSAKRASYLSRSFYQQRYY